MTTVQHGRRESTYAVRCVSPPVPSCGLAVDERVVMAGHVPTSVAVADLLTG